MKERSAIGVQPKWRLPAFAFAVAILTANTGSAAVAPAPQPVQISIGGGAVDSAAFRWSSALAEILSRPPGLPECDPSSTCGVAGVVASAQTYDSPQALLDALVEGKATTAIIPALPLYRAICAPAKNQPPPPVAALKNLYRQPVQIIVPASAVPAEPRNFVGKTIAIGDRGSDSEVVALALIDAYALPRAKIKLQRLSPALALAAVKSGAAFAAVLVGHAFDTPVSALLGHGYTLMSLPDTPERRRLLQALPTFEPDAISPGAYPGLPAVSILAQPVTWIAGLGLDSKLTVSLVSALSEPHNLARLSELVDPIAPMPEGEAFLHLPAPAAIGAAIFAEKAHLPFEALACNAKLSAAAQASADIRDDQVSGLGLHPARRHQPRNKVGETGADGARE